MATKSGKNISKDSKGAKRFARIAFKSPNLRSNLRDYRQLFIDKGEPTVLVIPYVLACAACLEATLNDKLFDFAFSRFGKEVSDGLMSLSLPQKLESIVPLLTDGAYRFEKGHWVYRRLRSLISVRNAITHSKPKWEETVANEDDMIEIPLITSGVVKVPRIFCPWAATANNIPSPIEFHEALEKFDKWFFRRCPDKLHKVEMVVATASDKLTPLVTTMVMDTRR